MAFVHGKDAVFKVKDSGGTLRDLSSFLASVSLKTSAAADETTTMGKASKTYIAGLKDASISGQGYYDSTATTGPDTVLFGILGHATPKDFEYGPEGGTSGKVKYSGTCIVTSFEPGQADVNGVVPFTFDAQVTGDVTRGTFA